MSNLGYHFETEIVDSLRDLLREFIDKSKKNKVFRVIGSGRNKLATKTGEDNILEGDVSVEMEFLPKNLLIECKHYKSKTSKGKTHPVKKEWVDQALDEAIKNNRISIVAIKFKSTAPNSKDLQKYKYWYDGKFGNSIHYIIPEIHFKELLLWFSKVRNACINNKKELIQSLSDEELMEEMKRRLRGVKECSEELSNGGKKDNLKNTKNGIINKEN